MSGLKFGPRKMGLPKEEWAVLNAKHIATAGGKFGPRKLLKKGESALVLEPVPSGIGEGAVPPPPANRTDLVPVAAALAVIRGSESDLAEALALEVARGGGPRKTVLAGIRDEAEARQQTVLHDIAVTELQRLSLPADSAEGAEGAEAEASPVEDVT